MITRNGAVSVSLRPFAKLFFIIFLSWPGSAVAQQGSLIVTVADGKPWTMTNADGSSGEVTLSPGGKGQMQLGSRIVSPTWRQNENGQLCVKPAFVVPERCATLRRDGQTIIGMNNGAIQFRLSRP